MGGGMKPAPLAPGMHFILPFIEKATDFETRARHKNFRSSTASRGECPPPDSISRHCRPAYTCGLAWPLPRTDLQQVNIDLRVLHEPDQYKLPSIYQELGVDYDERVLPSIANEVLKAVVVSDAPDDSTGIVNSHCPSNH